MVPDLERTSPPSAGRLVTVDSCRYGGGIKLTSLEQHFFFLAMGLHSLPVMPLPATSLANLLNVLFTIIVAQIALLLTGDFIFQRKSK